MKTKIISLILGSFLVSGAWAAPIPEARTLRNEPFRFGDFEVHYSAFNSTFLVPDVARKYQLERSPRYGLINISVRDVGSQLGKAVSASLEGHLQNLLQQKTALTFREIKEGLVIYYLAGFRFSNEEMLEFNIDVKPEGSDEVHKVRFRQQFYQDGE